MERYGVYGVSLRIQSECGKIRTRITPNTDTFHGVIAITKRWKGDHLSVQHDVIESTHISNVSMKGFLSHKNTEQELTLFLEKQVVNYLKSQDISFVVAGSSKTHIKLAPLMFLVTITRKVTDLCAIAWD